MCPIVVQMMFTLLETFPSFLLCPKAMMITVPFSDTVPFKYDRSRVTMVLTSSDISSVQPIEPFFFLKKKKDTFY